VNQVSLIDLRNIGVDRCAATAASILLNGGVVVAPTDTVYGLLGLFRSEKAIEKIYRIKGRDQEKRLIALVADIQSAALLSSRTLPEFVEEFWPGPLTVVLPSTSAHPLGWPTQAVRVPDDPWIKTLLNAVGGPLFAPSANPEGKQPATSAAEAAEYFADTVDLYINGDNSRINAPASTIIGWEDNGWKLLRQGAIPVDQMGSVLYVKIKAKDNPGLQPQDGLI